MKLPRTQVNVYMQKFTNFNVTRKTIYKRKFLKVTLIQEKNIISKNC